MFCVCELLWATTKDLPAPPCPCTRLWGCHPLSGPGSSCLWGRREGVLSPSKTGKLAEGKIGLLIPVLRSYNPELWSYQLGFNAHIHCSFNNKYFTVYMSTLIRLHVLKNSPCAGHRLHCMDMPSAKAVWWSRVSGRETYDQSQSVSVMSWDKLSGKSSSIPLPAKQAGSPQPSCTAGLHAQHFWRRKGQDRSRWPPLLPLSCSPPIFFSTSWRKGPWSAPVPSKTCSSKVSKAGFMHFINDGRKWIWSPCDTWQMSWSTSEWVKDRWATMV